MEIGEVLVVINDVAFCHLAEHGVTQNGHDEENEHQKDKHVEQRVNGHHDCLQERLQFFVSASKSEHTSDSHDTHDSSKLWTDGQNLTTRLLLAIIFWQS